ncbi:MAG: ABC transporter ATP-binding protein [Bacteroidota bacterium]
MKDLVIHAVSKSFDGGKYYAVNEVSLSLERGKICAIVGKSGSGKTTLLRLIAGLERPQSGHIEIKGSTVTSPKKFVVPRKRNVGMVFQAYALFPHLTIDQNIGYGLDRKDPKTINQLLELIRLEGFNNRYPHELSGGEQQRVALARALACKPKILLLDEPFSSLDAGLRAELRKEVKRIVKEVEITMIFITHDIRDAIAIADEVAFMQAGKIIENGTIRSVVQQPKHPVVQSLFTSLRESSAQILDFLQEKIE